MSKPRVTAHYRKASGLDQRMCGNELEGPAVTVTVEFTLGDHDYATALLDRAVRDVAAQIEATHQGATR